MCDVPSIAVFCSEYIERFHGTASKLLLLLLLLLFILLLFTFRPSLHSSNERGFSARYSGALVPSSMKSSVQR